MPTPVSFDNEPFTIRTPEKKTEPETPEKKWTPEEVEEMAAAAMGAYGMTPSPKKAAKDAETPKEPGDQPKTDATPEDQSQPAPAKAAKKPAAKKKDDPDMADRIAAKIGEQNEKLLERLAPKPDQTEPAPDKPAVKSEREAENEHLREVFAAMSEASPANASLPQKFDEFLKREVSYQSTWENENPGKAFDPAAEEHEEWYEQNQPDYDERLFRRTEIQIEANRILSEREQQTQSKTAFQNAITLAEESFETISEALETDVKTQLEEFIGENNVLESGGPVAEKYQSVLKELSDRLTLVSVLLTPGVGVPYNPQDPTHAAVASDVMEMDADIAALSEAEQRQLLATAFGKKSRLLAKKFVPAQEFQNLSEADRARAWNICTEPELVSKLMAVKAKESMKGWLEALFSQVGKKRVSGETSQTPSTSASAALAAAAPASTKPSPPGLSQGSSGVTPQSGSSTKPVDSWEGIASRF